MNNKFDFSKYARRLDRDAYVPENARPFYQQDIRAAETKLREIVTVRRAYDNELEEFVSVVNNALGDGQDFEAKGNIPRGLEVFKIHTAYEQHLWLKVVPSPSSLREVDKTANAFNHYFNNKSEKLVGYTPIRDATHPDDVPLALLEIEGQYDGMAMFVTSKLPNFPRDLLELEGQYAFDIPQDKQLPSARESIQKHIDLTLLSIVKHLRVLETKVDDIDGDWLDNQLSSLSNLRDMSIKYLSEEVRLQRIRADQKLENIITVKSGDTKDICFNDFGITRDKLRIIYGTNTELNGNLFTKSWKDLLELYKTAEYTPEAIRQSHYGLATVGLGHEIASGHPQQATKGKTQMHNKFEELVTDILYAGKWVDRDISKVIPRRLGLLGFNLGYLEFAAKQANSPAVHSKSISNDWRKIFEEVLVEASEGNNAKIYP